MRILTRSFAASPDWPDFTRESLVAEYGNGERTEIWLDLPTDVVENSSDLANHWLIIAYFLALYRGEDLEISLPVDSTLIRNLRNLNYVWNQWFALKHVVTVSAPQATSYSRDKTDTSLFFTGGIDSSFSLVRLEEDAPVSDLLTVWGFDIPLSEPDAFHRLTDRMAAITESYGKRLVKVATNLRSIAEPYRAKWMAGHAPALAAVAHALGHRYRAACIASSHDYGTLIPWGSHPLTDPLFSSSDLSIIHHGATFTRMEKLAHLVSDSLALSHLHVCWIQKNDENCSRCAKCLRTMLAIDLLGHRAEAKSFDWQNYTLDNWIFLKDDNEINFIKEVMNAAKEKGRQDIEDFCRKSVEKSQREIAFLRISGYVGRLPFLWRYEGRLRRLIKKIRGA